MSDEGSQGPLTGLRVVEFASLGPGPHAAMLLADMGAQVVRIDREGGAGPPNPIVDRGRSMVTLDIRSDAGRAFCLDATDHADVLIEGYRPGVMERLGLGPDTLCERNPRLIYGRMTGWGQTGPWAQAAGHDINYIAITGALAAFGTPGQPAVPPLNLVGDFGGGSMFLVTGILAALWERERSGRGQVIDAAIVDGVGSLMTMVAGLVPSGFLSLERERSILGGAAPFYRCYICADGREVAIGAVEPHFYRDLLARIGAPEGLHDRQYDEASWGADSALLAGIFLTRTAAQWTDLLGGTDACFAPVLPLAEAPHHPQLAARASFIDRDGLAQPAPAPRFSRTPGQARDPSPDGRAVVESWTRKA